MIRLAVLSMLALGSVIGCSENQDSSASASPVFFVVKAIDDKYQSSPVAPYSTSHEIDGTVVVGCRSREGLSFDQIQSVFYAADKPWSGVTHVLDDDDSIMAYYSQKGMAGAPDVPSPRVFELKHGEGMPVVLATANSDYGLLVPGTDREVRVELRLKGKTVYGPFDIGLPWPK